MRLLLLLCFPAVLLCQPDLGYKLTPNWPNAPRNAQGSAGIWNFIQVSSVAVDSHGHILVLHRGELESDDVDREIDEMVVKAGGLVASGLMAAAGCDR